MEECHHDAALRGVRWNATDRALSWWLDGEPPARIDPGRLHRIIWYRTAAVGAFQSSRSFIGTGCLLAQVRRALTDPVKRRSLAFPGGRQAVGRALAACRQWPGGCVDCINLRSRWWHRSGPWTKAVQRRGLDVPPSGLVR